MRRGLMLYKLLYGLKSYLSPFNVFRYITFRTALAVLTALIISFVFGPYVIRKLSGLSLKQRVRGETPERHKKEKEGIPTMGGILILASIIVPAFLWVDLGNSFFWLILSATLLFGALGFADDYIKAVKGNPKGLTIKTKLMGEMVIALFVGTMLYYFAGKGMFTTTVSFPFIKQLNPDLGWGYILFAVLILVGSANAVNFTDGLDGLAIGAVLIASATYTVLTYLAGHYVAANYLLIPHVRGVGEITIFAGAMVGASLGFLWFNCHPAKMFMGDVGSLALGGAIGTIALLIKQEILLVIVGGLFVIEALSVIIQIISFRFYRRRVFRMAPLHHHFELLGWEEPKVIVRFWIIAIIFALISLSTLKLR
jgi:phospho-N-acetylmuramoyl-pentapeptide-transferase